MPNLSALEDQLADVMREANRRGYIIVNSCMEQKYGNELWRPDLFAMLQAIQQGRVNAVVVQSLDRLSHDLNVLYVEQQGIAYPCRSKVPVKQHNPNYPPRGVYRLHNYEKCSF